MSSRCRPWTLSINAGGDDRLRNLENGDIVRLSDNGLHELSVKRSAFHGRAEVEMTAASVVDEEETLVTVGNAAGLVESGQCGAVVPDVHELLLVVVVKDDVGADDGLDGVLGSAGYGREGRVVDGQNGDGTTSVDFTGETGIGDVLIEQPKIRVLSQQSCDIVGPSDRRESQQNRKAEEETSGAHASRLFRT